MEQEKQFVLRAGQRSPELLDLFKNQNALCAAIISAGNPFTEKLSAGANAKRHWELEAELVMELNFRYLRADDPEFQRQKLLSSSDRIIENRQR